MENVATSTSAVTWMETLTVSHTEPVNRNDGYDAK